MNTTSLKTIQFSKAASSNVIVLGVGEKRNLEGTYLWKSVKPADRKTINSLSKEEFGGNKGDTFWIRSLTGPHVLLVGLGDGTPHDRDPALILRKILGQIQGKKETSFSVSLAEFGLEDEQRIRLSAESLLLASYEYNGHKEEPKEKRTKVKKVQFIVDEITKEQKEALRVGRITAEATNYARGLSNIPGGDMTPELLAEKARQVGDEVELDVRVWDKRKLEQEGMGGILGVARGSSEEPALIRMDYKGADGAPLVLVGKGITFDSGGLNLKPDSAMKGMHLDMAGGAAVIGAMRAIAQLKLPINVIALIPAAENMPGNSGYRPGDILRTYAGKTIEIGHTDAEGRVVMADALAYATKELKPRLIIDIATLTGSALVALGERVSALLAPDPETAQFICEAGSTSADHVWQLPLWPEYIEDIKGTFADVNNDGKKRWGGAITAGAFLWQFAMPSPWAHIDIAPTMETIEEQALSKGASGAGTRLLVECARKLASDPDRIFKETKV